MSTQPAHYPTRTRAARAARVPVRTEAPAARPSRPSPRPVMGCAPTSMLDEARRRMKSNMLAIASLLRLDPVGFERDETEIVLTEMEARLQSMAQLHRSLCRFGDFEQVDLAVYLRHASQLRNSPPRSALPGAWAVESDGSLIWTRDEGDAREGSADLDTAIESMPPAARELARRAVFACAILAPPWIFGWRAPQPGTSGIGHLARPGDIGVRLRATSEGVSVELSISDRGPGLPEFFDSRLQRKLALELVSVLARLVKGSFNDGPEAAAVFEVRFVPSYRSASAVETQNAA